MRAELIVLFERLVRELPLGAAEMTSDDNGVDLNPANANAISCSVHCDDAQVYSFSLGTRGYWEFPYERRYRNGERPVLAEIEEMARAVIAGNCEVERRWFSMTTRIWVGDYTYRTTNVPMVPIPPFFVRHYAPYV